MACLKEAQRAIMQLICPKYANLYWLFVIRKDGMVEYQKNWNIGIMECWNNEIPEEWNNGKME